MDSWGTSIFVGALGSVIGAVLVMLASFGARGGGLSLARSARERHEEAKLWESMNLGIRQAITNQYIFSILWFLFLGNFFWVISEVVPPLAAKVTVPVLTLEVIYFVALGAGLICFLLGLEKFLAYARIRALDKIDDYKRIVSQTSQNSEVQGCRGSRRKAAQPSQDCEIKLLFMWLASCLLAVLLIRRRHSVLAEHVAGATRLRRPHSSQLFCAKLVPGSTHEWSPHDDREPLRCLALAT